MYEKDMVCMLSPHEQPHTSSADDAPIHAVSEPSHINPPGARPKLTRWKGTNRKRKHPTAQTANVLSVSATADWLDSNLSLSWNTWCHWTSNEDGWDTVTEIEQ